MRLTMPVSTLLPPISTVIAAPSARNPAIDSRQPQWRFYSAFISSARRLPNGNTLIDEGMNGRFFQVTPQGDIVWEYVSPYVAPSAVGGNGKQVDTNWVYRAQPVPKDWVPGGR